MPEGLEAEIWRRAAQPIVGRSIRHVWYDERVAPSGLADTLRDARIEAVDRVGKVVRIVTDAGVLGLHLGMTGRLEIDGAAPIARLEYASGADRPNGTDCACRPHPSTPDSAPAGPTSIGDPDRSTGVPAVRMNDPRRLGRLSLDEPLELGPDLLTLTSAALRSAIGRRTVTVKSLLLDQSAVAGLGNLCADEVLFWAGVAPGRRVDELSSKDVTAIARACGTRLPKMLEAGGSTSGSLSPQVRAGPGECPSDRTPLRRATIGGRTAVWCPTHQR